MKKLKHLSLLSVALFLGACGGGGETPFSGGSSDGGSGGSGGSDGGADTDAGVVQMGSGALAGFQNQVINLGGVTALSAGGSVSMSVSFVLNDGSGTLTAYTDAVSVTFSSQCISQGLATVDPSSTIISNGGTATATYVAQGCDTGAGGEVITARATIGSTNLSAQATIIVAGADVGSIEFVSTNPDLIGLKGTGGRGVPEQSTVRFKVVDETKGPVAGKTVDFTMTTQVGGITFTPAEAISDANGEVQTIVQSGTVATSIRVTATERETGISTQSSVLTISTGIPHQNAFSIALEKCNVPGAFDKDGVTVPVSVILSDRFQNPVPDGTAVAFTTEGGQIVNGCTTAAGRCQVNWVSADPRPEPLAGDLPGQTGGRVTILATAIGEESFLDQNGDFVYDSGENFGDLEEAFRDDNENFQFDIGVDGFFLDFNNSGTQDAADTTFNGLLCASGCSANETIGISAEAILVMGTDELDLDVLPIGITLAPKEEVGITVFVTDTNGNFPSVGTTIGVNTVSGGSVVGPAEFTIPDSCGAPPGAYLADFVIKAGDDIGSGTIFIQGTTPSGLVTRLNVSFSVVGP